MLTIDQIKALCHNPEECKDAVAQYKFGRADLDSKYFIILFADRYENVWCQTFDVNGMPVGELVSVNDFTPLEDF